MDTKGRAFAYVRFSDEAQRGNSSVERQRLFTEEALKKFNLEIVDTLLDDGVSARYGLNLQSEFSSLYDLIREGDYIIIEHTTRLSRADFDVGYAAIVKLIKEKGANVIFGRDEDGELLVLTRKNINSQRILHHLVTTLGQAQKENEDRIKRLEDQYQIKYDKMKKGEYVPIGQRPCWLTCPRDPTNGRCLKQGRYEIDESKATIIRDIFDRYTNKKQSILAICTEYNRTKVPPITRLTVRKDGANKRQWYAMTIYHILRNKAVIGYFQKRKGNHWHGDVEWEGKVFPSILSDEGLFHRTQERLTNCSQHCVRVRQISDKAVNLFNGLILCKCGHRLNLRVNRKYGPAAKAYMICANGINGACPSKFKGLLVSQIESALKSILSQSTFLKQVLCEDKPKAPSRIPLLQSELETIRKERRNLYNLVKQLGENESPSDLVKDIQSSLSRERILNGEIESEHVRLAGNPHLKETLNNYSTNLKTKWNQSEYRERIRVMLQDVIDHMEASIDDKTLTIWFKSAEAPIEVKLESDGFIIDDEKFPYDK